MSQINVVPWEINVARGSVSQETISHLAIGLCGNDPEIPDGEQFVMDFAEDWWMVGNRRRRKATLFNSRPTLGEIALAVLPDRLKWPLCASESPATLGRNDPCPCGSGKKYKKCCLKKEGP